GTRKGSQTKSTASLHDTGAHQIVEVDHSDDLVIAVQDGHRDDAVSFHAVNHCAPQLVDVRNLGISVHDFADRNRENILFVFHQPRQIAGSDDAGYSACLAGDDRDSAPFGELD